MSSAIVRTEPAELAAEMWTEKQKALIKRTVAPDATDDELAMFLHIAAKSGLDPLQKQVHFTKRNGRVTIIAGIDGLQARAAREPDFRGVLHGVVCQRDAFDFDATTGHVVNHKYNAFSERGPILGAWATVQREGKLPFTALVRFSEFNQPNSPTWRQMPNVMIAKVARSTALRMAYPERFGGIYEAAEMDQANPRAQDDAQFSPEAVALADAASKPATRTEALKARLQLASSATPTLARVEPLPVEPELEPAPAAPPAAPPPVPPPAAPPTTAGRPDPTKQVAFGPMKGRPIKSLSMEELSGYLELSENAMATPNPDPRWEAPLRANIQALHEEMHAREVERAESALEAEEAAKAGAKAAKPTKPAQARKAQRELVE
jgi:phage recombination protein Bet